MPSKERSERKIARAEAQKRLDTLFQNAPEYAKQNPGDPFPLGGGINELLQTCPELRLKGGLLGQTEDGYIGERTDLMRKGGINAGIGSSDIRHDRVQNLKKRYPNLWGKRSAAKKIAEEQNLSVRTIQKYFKEFPTK